MPTIDKKPPETRSAIQIAAALVRDATGPLEMEAARALRDVHDDREAWKRRVEYLESAIEELSLHNGHREIEQSNGWPTRLRSWAETVVRGGNLTKDTETDA